MHNNQTQIQAPHDVEEAVSNAVGAAVEQFGLLRFALAFTYGGETGSVSLEDCGAR